MIEGVSSGRWPKSNREYMTVELVLRFPSACSSYMNASGQATREREHMIGSGLDCCEAESAMYSSLPARLRGATSTTEQ